MYQPLKVNQGSRTGFRTSTMPRAGVNKEDNPQMMSLEYAIDIINYVPYRYGLEKRKGIREIFARAGAVPITLLEEFTAGVWIVGYGTKIEAYNTTTSTWTTIKSDFSVNAGFDGERYGEYFFVCNGVEKIWVITSALAISEVAASPICGGLKVIGPRLYAFNLSDDDTAVQYSEVDDGSNPPFTAWTMTTAADTGGKVRYRNAGTVRSVVQVGQVTAVLSDKGFYAFYISILDSAGTLKKVEVMQNYTEDYGGARGAIETPQGVFYANEAGLWQMVGVGAVNEPMSRQQMLTSKLLGSQYFKGISQTSLDIAYDINQNCIFVTCAKDSAFNNLVIGLQLDTKALFTFRNWNINRFAKSGDTLYGASSVKTSVYELFTGYADEDLAIGTEYYQEVPLSTLFYKHALNGLYAGGFLSQNTKNKIAFDIYDVTGKFIPDRVQYDWTVNDNGSLAVDEWGTMAFGDGAFGGGVDKAGLIESFGGGSPRINNLQRLRIKVTGSDKMRHILSWISVKTTQKGAIQRRNFSQITT
jgi:hypothetical protein